MKEIKIFNNDQFGRLRAVPADGELWFVAADACTSLDHSNVTVAMSRLDDDEKGKLNLGLSGGDTNVVNFPGLLSLILGSRKPEAREYKRWVTHEVMPSIHNHGGYLTPEKIEEALSDPDTIIRLATDLKAERERRAALEAENAALAPKALFADAVEASDTCILIGDLAKLLRQNGVDIGQNRLFGWLRENGYLMKGGSAKNMPTQRAMDMGLFQVKERTVQNPDGSVRVTRTTKVTGKGQRYFVNAFLDGRAA